jgi:serine O-acetyltransferase
MAKLEVVAEIEMDSIWRQLRASAEAASREEPQLGSQMNAVILSHDDLAGALSFQIARKLADGEMSAMSVREVCLSAFKADPAMVAAAEADLQAVAERDPAIRNLLQPFLYFKGFQALQAWRVAHWLWGQGRETLAFHFQSRISELFQLDIHPAARMGKGLFLDHGTGIVIGETAVVGDDVSMLHGVTLGGTGAERGDRHPKIGKGVLLGAGAKVLGNIHGRRLRQGGLGLGGAEGPCRPAAPWRGCRRGWSTARPASRAGPDHGPHPGRRGVRLRHLTGSPQPPDVSRVRRQRPRP